MPDREKVIKAIEICIKNGCKDGTPNQLCPYSSEVGCDLNQILADALAILKEQKATIEILVKDITFHNCNNCNRKDCESKPKVGQPVRSNCIYWLEGR